MALLVLTLAVGCGKLDYDSTVRSGAKAIPIAVEMEEVFGDADHFITHFGRTDRSKTWTTDVYFGGRYNLAMQVDVEIDYQTSTVRQTGEPRFWLLEVTRVSEGGTRANFRGLHKEFGQVEWRKLCDADGDWAAIGVKIDVRSVPDFDKFVRSVRKDRLPITLLRAANDRKPLTSPGLE